TARAPRAGRQKGAGVAIAATTPAGARRAPGCCPGRKPSAASSPKRSCAAAKKRAAREKMDTEDHEGLLELTLWQDNMRQAWRTVKANDGAAGVDGKDIAQTAQHLRRHWPKIAQQLRRGRYRPGAIRQ